MANNGCMANGNMPKGLCPVPHPIVAFCLAESIRFTFVQGGGEWVGSREIGGKPSGCQVG